MKATEVLAVFTPDRPRWSLAELAEATGYPKTTVYTIAATLVHTGLLERAHEQYALGHGIIRLSQAVRVNVEIRDRAAPILRELADATRESVYLTVPDGAWVLYVYAIESIHRLQARSAIGDRAHFHSTSVGKAMLAWMDRARVDAIVEEAGLPAQTGQTITDPRRLESELESIRSRGYAIDRSENEIATFCVGVPILDHRGHVVGACSVSGNTDDLIVDRLAETAGAVMRAGDAISRRMGYVPHRPAVVPPAE